MTIVSVIVRNPLIQISPSKWLDPPYLPFSKKPLDPLFKIPGSARGVEGFLCEGHFRAGNVDVVAKSGSACRSHDSVHSQSSILVKVFKRRFALNWNRSCDD